MLIDVHTKLLPVIGLDHWHRQGSKVGDPRIEFGGPTFSPPSSFHSSFPSLTLPLSPLILPFIPPLPTLVPPSSSLPKYSYLGSAMRFPSGFGENPAARHVTIGVASCGPLGHVTPQPPINDFFQPTSEIWSHTNFITADSIWYPPKERRALTLRKP